MTISTAIHYKNINGYWVTDGWWNIGPGETAYVVDTIHPFFYYYGESADGKIFWEGEDNYQTVRGSNEAYGFRKYDIQNWEYYIQNEEYFEFEWICP